MGDIARNENFKISAITVLRLRAIWQRFCRTDFAKNQSLRRTGAVRAARRDQNPDRLKPGTAFGALERQDSNRETVHIERRFGTPRTFLNRCKGSCRSKLRNAVRES